MEVGLEKLLVFYLLRIQLLGIIHIMESDLPVVTLK